MNESLWLFNLERGRGEEGIGCGVGEVDECQLQ